MTNLVNRQVKLRSRPTGIPGADHFEISEDVVPDLNDGRFLVRNHYLSVDPAMRGWVNAAANYAEPVALGSVMRSLATGEVVASANNKFNIGDIVTGWFGWQDYSVSDGKNVIRTIAETDLPMSTSLGVLGLNGVTAYFGLTDVGRPKDGETVVVSTAAGAVGSCVGQIAKILGCRTVGLTGSDEKVAQCRDEFGFDASINYRTADDLSAAVAHASPDGVDVYFDNTAGNISDAVLEHINIGARIVICGTASIANWDPWPIGPRVERRLLVKRASMHGFLVLEYFDRYEEAVGRLAQWVRAGRLRYREDIRDGIDKAPTAIECLYRGENSGKLLIRLTDHNQSPI